MHLITAGSQFDDQGKCPQTVICAFLCLAAIVCGFVRTCHAQAYAATPDPDAPFKLLTQKWGQALADLTVTVLAHNGTNNSSGIYLGILLSLWGDKNALAFETQKDPPISGERCLELMTVFVQDFANATLHQNDPIVGTVVLPLQGEQLYQTQLQNFGKGLQSFYDMAAPPQTPTPQPREMAGPHPTQHSGYKSRQTSGR
ncbi:hypothetical protein BV898_10252 [Hypsibius exemplaris]|uniref:Uncharacterized protein n=1 Tax=Hypsibius exemplaris TaxID=2072580 RepID=A0A1W0WJY8_HYPEX|nr:hypothetical protein BV898_10252 [Hypsibius exemplaris]